MREQKLGLGGSEIALVCPAEMGGVWEQAVHQAKRELSEVFGVVAVEIQEIGSGAIQSDAAKIFCKPIVDLAVAVRSIPEAKEKMAAMRAAGYIHRFKRDNDNRMFFIKRTADGEHTHHVYVLQAGCALWDDFIRFREYLSTNSEKLKKYMMIKQELANRYPRDRNLYNRSRAKFMQNVAKESNEFFILDQEITVTVTNPATEQQAYGVGFDAGQKEKNGTEQTVYVIGQEDDAEVFTGRVAAIVRTAQNEERLVAVPKDRMIYEPEIEHILGLQSKGSAVTYTCSHEKSCGAVLFTKVDGERRYLLIKNRSLHAGFPKGHIEYGESEMDTVRREISEETGLDVEIVDGFRRDYDYKVRFFINKTAVYFLGYFDAEKQTIVPQEGEVLDYWIIPLEEALEHLGFEQDRKILRDADAHLDALGY